MTIRGFESVGHSVEGCPRDALGWITRRVARVRELGCDVGVQLDVRGAAVSRQLMRLVSHGGVVKVVVGDDEFAMVMTMFVGRWVRVVDAGG